MKPLRRSRSRRRGLVAVEELLGIAAIMGCFVVPISYAARSAGSRIVEQMDQTHDALMKQQQP